MATADRCSQCRAALAPGETCQDRFHRGQALEVEQPAYYVVHHLSVLCYMLQHNVYSRSGWLAARQLLAQFVGAGLTPAGARRQIDSGRRTGSLTRGPKLPGVELIQWDYTVADVRLDSAAEYTADVRRWAERVLANSADLVRSTAGRP